MRLSVEETLRNLKQVEEKYKIRFTPTGEVNISEMARDCIDAIKALQHENEQLRARVARMREALIIANNYMPDIGQFCACGKCKTCGADINYAGYEHCVKCARVIIDEALSDTPADYHNPADVEALRKAREALVECIDALELCTHNELCKIAVSPYDMIRDAKEALAEIDKAIGGGDVDKG